MIPVTVPVTLSATDTTIPVMVGELSADIPVAIGVQVVVVGADNFDGEYEYTPSEEMQVIPIYGKRATQDITINPIPSNYGRIDWNGAVLTVS